MFTKVKNRWFEDTISHFMTELIDYAGIFPPAKLPLQKAIYNYNSYKNDSDSWMLGKFVIPAARLKELHPYKKLFSEENQLRLSVVLSNNLGFDNDLDAINSFIEFYQTTGVIEAIEVPPFMPLNSSGIEILERQLGKIDIFFEVSKPEQATQLMDEIQRIKQFSSSLFGIKLRMGSASLTSIPSVKQTAYVIKKCQERGLKIKFTADLHLPFSDYSCKERILKYGFVNVFVASIMTSCRFLSTETIQSILIEKNPTSFIFTPNELSWCNLTVSSSEIFNARNFFASSFGSCSFDEPRLKFGELQLFLDKKMNYFS
ncbi:hypothetical protein NX029_11690 [Cytobacillus firmus]|nr:hypothetical protein [Cytobacillus firmus]